MNIHYFEDFFLSFLSSSVQSSLSSKQPLLIRWKIAKTCPIFKYDPKAANYFKIILTLTSWSDKLKKKVIVEPTVFSLRTVKSLIFGFFAVCDNP
jgi:hypothetical protein